MSRAATIFLVFMALALAAFLAFVDPRIRNSREDAVREGSVLEFDPALITGFTVTTGDYSIEIRREGEDWVLGPGARDDADPAAVHDILSALLGLKVFDRIPASEIPGSRELKRYGLDNQKRTLDLIGDKNPSLLFGREAPGEGRIYVRRSDARDIYVTDDRLQRLIFRPQQAFSSPRLTPLDPGRVDRFSLRRNGGEMEVARTAGGWEILRPLRAKADSAKVEAFLGRVLGAHILAREGADAGDQSVYGLAEGAGELAIFADGKEKPITLHLGKMAPGEPAGVFVQSASRDSIFRLPPQIARDFAIGPGDLRDPHFADVNLDVIDRIRIESGGHRLLLVRGDGGWKVAEPKISGTATVDGGKVAAFAAALAGSSALDFLPSPASDRAKYGLDKPSARVVFSSWASENTPEESAGEHAVLSLAFGRAGDGKTYAAVDDAPEVFQIPPAALDAISSDPAAWIAGGAPKKP